MEEFYIENTKGHFWTGRKFLDPKLFGDFEKKIYKTRKLAERALSQLNNKSDCRILPYKRKRFGINI